MLKLVKRVMPRRLKLFIGGLLAARWSVAEDRRLRSHDVRLTARHLEGCRLLPDRRALLACLPSGGVIAEVGVAEGLFSREILEVCRPTTLHLIDKWSAAKQGYDAAEYLKVLRAFGGPEHRDVVVIHRGVSWDEIGALPAHSLDWIYIDAGHSYADVTKDLAAALRAVKPDGYIAGHDYVRWSTPNGRFGVVEAVNELCLTHGFGLRYLTLEPDMHLSYAVQRLT